MAAEERVAIFIDASNLRRNLEGECGYGRIDFGRFAEKLCAGRRLVRTYFYQAALRQDASSPDAYASQQRFLRAISFVPYFEVKLGRLERRGDTFIEKGVDINLVVDMLQGAYQGQYDTAVLVSGDGDFSAAVRAVKARGCHVELACPRRGLSDELRATCDRWIPLDGAFLGDLWLAKR